MESKNLNVEYAKNLAIYQELATYAQIAFESVKCSIGTHKAEEVAKSITKGTMQFADDFNTKEEITVGVDGFTCSFQIGNVFRILKQVATAYGIRPADRITFARAAATTETTVIFDVPKDSKNLVKCTDKSKLHPVLNDVFVDAARKTLVASDGHILQVIAVPGMMVSENANENGYILPVSLFKGGKGTITISASNTASNGAQTAELIEGRYVNYASVIPSYCEAQKIDLTGIWKQFAKAMAEATKFADFKHQVNIIGTKGESTITLTSKDSDWNQETSVTVAISEPLQMDFHVSVNGSYIARIKQADALYIGTYGHPITFTSDGALTLVMPIQVEGGHVTFKPSEETRPGMEIAGITQPEIKGDENQSFAIGDRVRTKYGFGTVAKLPGYNFGWGARKGYTVRLDKPRALILCGKEYPDYDPEIMPAEMEMVRRTEPVNGHTIGEKVDFSYRGASISGYISKFMKAEGGTIYAYIDGYIIPVNDLPPVAEETAHVETAPPAVVLETAPICGPHIIAETRAGNRCATRCACTVDTGSIADCAGGLPQTDTPPDISPHTAKVARPRAWHAASPGSTTNAAAIPHTAPPLRRTAQGWRHRPRLPAGRAHQAAARRVHSRHKRTFPTKVGNFPRPPTKRQISKTKVQKIKNPKIMTHYKLSLTSNGHNSTFGITHITAVLHLLQQAALKGERISNVTIYKYDR